MLKLLAVIAISTCCTMMYPKSVDALLDAMVQVESGGNSNPPDGDGGRSIGPLQIMKGYWQDANVPGEYEDCRNEEYARKVVLAYWKRYCPAALKSGDLQTLARIHNGGPRGAKKKATIVYWKKVKKELEERGNTVQ